MSKRIFVSYSSPDYAKADTIRTSLEAAGITCWIAPRDLEAGDQWGGSIVQAIQGCQAVVVVFSEAANKSPQVAREMELSVANRKPLITVRVADDMPTDDMQYFLGVSHWFNAFPKPIEDYLADIVASVKNKLDKEANPWSSAMGRMPKSRNGQLLAGLGAVVLVAILVASFMKPPGPGNLAKLMKSPLVGRWQATIADESGKKADCVLDVPKGSVMAGFSDTCPAPFGGVQGQLTAQNGVGIFAPDVFKHGDGGSFAFYGGSAGNLQGAFKVGLFGGLTTRDNRLGQIKWKSVNSSQPLPTTTEGVLSPTAPWPLSNVSGVIARANKLMRQKWTADAVLMEVNVKPGLSGGVDAHLTYYSPSQRHTRTMSPNAASDDLGALYAREMDTRESIPDQVLDLPAALKQSGYLASDVDGADLEWTNGGCGTGNFAIDNAILPRCPPGNFEGVQWRLMPKNTGKLRYVPASQ